MPKREYVEGLLREAGDWLHNVYGDKATIQLKYGRFLGRIAGAEVKIDSGGGKYTLMLMEFYSYSKNPLDDLKYDILDLLNPNDLLQIKDKLSQQDLQILRMALESKLVIARSRIQRDEKELETLNDQVRQLELLQNQVIGLK